MALIGLLQSLAFTKVKGLARVGHPELEQCEYHIFFSTGKNTTEDTITRFVSCFERTRKCLGIDLK